MIKIISVFVICTFIFSSRSGAQSITRETLTDGVQRWYQVSTDTKPAFFGQLEKNFNITLSNTEDLPFARSIAFLVGVSKYEYLSPQLPFVSNDLRLLGEYLLTKNGFDTIYVASDNIVSTSLIENYMVNKFRKSLKPDDRLFFYYSGHGADLGGKTGYLQFSEAQPDNFAFSVMAINRCEEWSNIIPASHILFLYDCCASGLAYTAKSTPVDPSRIIETTMQKNGSRTVISAGTSDEETFGVNNQSVFTREFLNALKTAHKDNQVFQSIHQIFYNIQQNVKDFSSRYDKKLTPRLWELQKDRYRGAFVFLAPGGDSADIDTDVLNLLNASRVTSAAISKTNLIFRTDPEDNFSLDQLKKIMIKNNFYDEFENAVGIGFNNDYIRSADDKLITDRASGLMWQSSGTERQMTLDEAKSYIQELNRSKFGGFNDWRLPTLEEALSLMERDKINGDLHIHPYFDDTQVEIWTADRAGPVFAWAVSFNLGISGRNLIGNYNAWVRAVR